MLITLLHLLGILDLVISFSYFIFSCIYHVKCFPYKAIKKMCICFFTVYNAAKTEFRLTDLEYNVQYGDRHSAAFQNLANEVQGTVSN